LGIAFEVEDIWSWTYMKSKNEDIEVWRSRRLKK
jgi:hypothetical protein